MLTIGERGRLAAGGLPSEYSTMDDERAPICPTCGVTMLPGTLSAGEAHVDWVCVECEESGEPES